MHWGTVAWNDCIARNTFQFVKQLSEAYEFVICNNISNFDSQYMYHMWVHIPAQAMCVCVCVRGAMLIKMDHQPAKFSTCVTNPNSNLDRYFFFINWTYWRIIDLKKENENKQFSSANTHFSSFFFFLLFISSIYVSELSQAEPNLATFLFDDDQSIKIEYFQLTFFLFTLFRTLCFNRWLESIVFESMSLIASCDDVVAKYFVCS